MSLNHDVSSIQAVLNLIGSSLVQRANQQPSAAEIGVSTSINNISETTFDVVARLAQGNAADLYTLNMDGSAKRKRGISINDVKEQMDHVPEGRLKQKTRSRDLMPPPPSPPIFNRPPYIYMPHVPEPNIEELLQWDELDESDGLQSGDDPLATNRQHYTRNFTHEVNAYRGALPPTPRTPSNNTHNQAHYVHVPRSPAPRESVVAGPLSGSTWLRQMDQAYNVFHRGSQSSSSPELSSHDGRMRRPQISDRGSLLFPLTKRLSKNTRGSSTRLYGSGSCLGLSRNARSSIRQPRCSPASASVHRQRLGEELSDLPCRISSNASDAATLIGSLSPRSFHSCGNVLIQQDSRLESGRDRAIEATKASDTDMLAGSLPPGRRIRESINSAVVSEHNNRLERLRVSQMGPHASNSHQSESSQGRMPTTDSQAAAARRRVNR